MHHYYIHSNSTNPQNKQIISSQKSSTMSTNKNQHKHSTTNQIQLSHSSAFKKFVNVHKIKLEESCNKENYHHKQSHDFDNYVDQRKFQNSFTLSSISTDTSQDTIVYCKQEKILLQDQSQLSTVEEELIYNAPTFKDNDAQTLSPKLKISGVIRQIYRPKINEKKKPNFNFKILSEVLNLTIYPTIPQQKPSNHKSQIKQEEKLFLQSYQSESKTSSNVNKKQSNPKSKKDQKKDKIAEKYILNTQHNKTEESQTKKTPITIQNDLESIDEIPGFLRNCKCCGKLIDKLCFKCPHLYCKAENCPRKRKKMLNEKMLERMKKQKIEEHYRQRELYEKIKLKHGLNFNPKLISDLAKKQQNLNSNSNKRSGKTSRNRNNEYDDSGDYELDLGQEEELDQNELYDESEDEQKEVSKTKKSSKNNHDRKKDEKVTQQKQNKQKVIKKRELSEKITKYLTSKIKKEDQQMQVKLEFNSSENLLASLGQSDQETQPMESVRVQNKKSNKKESRKVKKYDLFLDSDD